jgi:hypothetical protein
LLTLILCVSFASLQRHVSTALIRVAGGGTLAVGNAHLEAPVRQDNGR